MEQGELEHRLARLERKIATGESLSEIDEEKRPHLEE